MHRSDNYVIRTSRVSSLSRSLSVDILQRAEAAFEVRAKATVATHDMLQFRCNEEGASGAVIEGRGSGWKGRTLYTEVRAVRGERELMR